MKIKLVPQAKKFHKRWTTWVLGLAGMLTSLQAFMPSFQQYMSPEAYNRVMIVMLIATFIAAQIKQPALPRDDQ